MTEPQQRPGAFISYSHKDAIKITRQLASYLSIYADVFWDKNLRGGNYNSLLPEEIDNREYFIFIMTEEFLKSEWCQKELARAEEKGKVIIPVWIPDEAVHQELADKYTYANFSTDFDYGFQDLTRLIFGEPYLPWERLGYQPNDKVLACLQMGLFPGLISKEIAEWVIVERLWPHIEEYISTQDTEYFYTNPRTGIEVIKQLKTLRQQFEDNNDIIGFQLITEALSAIPTLENYSRKVIQLSNTQHEILGEYVFKIVQGTKKFCKLFAEATNAVPDFARAKNFFDSGVIEKIRELINRYARELNSRY